MGTNPDDLKTTSGKDEAFLAGSCFTSKQSALPSYVASGLRLHFDAVITASDRDEMITLSYK